MSAKTCKIAMDKNVWKLALCTVHEILKNKEYVLQADNKWLKSVNHKTYFV